MVLLVGECELKKLVLSGASIVCVGAGRRAERIQDFFEDFSVLEYIDLFIDGAQEKSGATIYIQNRSYNIYSYEAAKKVIKENAILLVTVRNYEEIIEKLIKDDEYKKYRICCLDFIRAVTYEDEAMKKAIPSNIKIYEDSIIPKVIHYCWFGKNPIPEHYRNWMESWRKYCPDYEIIEWNETNYDISKNRYMKEAYDAGKMGFVPDYARLDIIHEYGGIYLDTDVELIANLDELLFEDGYASFETKNYVNLGTGFGAKRNHPVIEQMLEDYEGRSFYNEDGTLNLVASPNYQTQVLSDNGLVKNGEYQIVNNFTIFPEKMLSGMNIYTRRVRPKDYTVSVHHYDGSWLQNEIRERNDIISKYMNEFK